MRAIKLLATGAFLVGAASMAVPNFATETDKAGQAYHHSGKTGHHHYKGDGQYAGHFGRLERALNLSDAQKETLKSQREAGKATRAALHGEIKKARLALNLAVEVGANEAELNALAEALGRVQAQQALTNAKSHQAFLAVLTDDQKQTLAELKAKRMERTDWRKGPREHKGK